MFCLMNLISLDEKLLSIQIRILEGASTLSMLVNVWYPKLFESPPSSSSVWVRSLEVTTKIKGVE